MKKLLIIALLGVFSLSAYAQSRPDLKGVIGYDRYEKSNKGVKPGMVIFAGNSITEGWPRSNAAFFKDNNFLGRGIGGQTTQGLLLRFRRDVIDLKPVAVIINMGTNDIAGNNGLYRYDLTLDCIKSMADIAAFNGIKVILSSVLPVKQYNWNKTVTDVPAKIDALNAAIKAYAQEKGFAYLDYNTAMRTAEGGLDPRYGSDGVHPNKEGYAVMEREAMKVIPGVLKGKKPKKAKQPKKK